MVAQHEAMGRCAHRQEAEMKAGAWLAFSTFSPGPWPVEWPLFPFQLNHRNALTDMHRRLSPECF